jgi:hypothetical protein
MNPDQKFWILKIIKKMGIKETIIVIKNVNKVYRGINMSKIKNCVCCKYFWK